MGETNKKRHEIIALCTKNHTDGAYRDVKLKTFGTRSNHTFTAGNCSSYSTSYRPTINKLLFSLNLPFY